MSLSESAQDIRSTLEDLHYHYLVSPQPTHSDLQHQQDAYVDVFLHHFKEYLLGVVCPKLNSLQDDRGEGSLDHSCSPPFGDVVRTLYDCVWPWVSYCRSKPLSVAPPRLGGLVTKLIQAALCVKPSKRFITSATRYYTEAFKRHCASCSILNTTTSVRTYLQEEGEEGGCERCRRTDPVVDFESVNKMLSDIGILEAFCGEIVLNVVCDVMRQVVVCVCKGQYETQLLDMMKTWIHRDVLDWIRSVLDTRENTAPGSGSGGEKDPPVRGEKDPTVRVWGERLDCFLYQEYSALRIGELFDIIIDFPESEIALRELKICLEKTNYRSTLMKSLKTSFETRLLQPGANTSDILAQYISSIRALQVLDPSGVILDVVCEPVKRYLRSREDTVRCIVVSMTDDSSSDLSEELVKAQPVYLEETIASDDESQDPDNWNPPPADAGASTYPKSYHSSDIISTLINIYGSREVFVSEYRTLLASRILTHYSFDTTRELRYLELLKLRFGESQLNFCEVMLRDVADSRRINHHITSLWDTTEKENKPDMDLNAMILSAEFWPSFREERIELPTRIKQALDTFRKSYERLKGMRTVEWKQNLGLVSLEIDVNGKMTEISVSPVHATIIMHFEDANVWKIDKLSATMQIAPTALRRKLAFWQGQGLIREDPVDVFSVTEEVARHVVEHGIPPASYDSDEESAMASVQDQKEEELQTYWQYISAMLTNLESLALERIHSMLKMFAMTGPSTVEFSVQELKHFLDMKVREQKLQYASGVYRLVKN